MSTAAYITRPLYDVLTGRFDPAQLRMVMIVRYLTPEDLAAHADVSRSSVYNARNGEPITDRVAMNILRALAHIKPRLSPIDSPNSAPCRGTRPLR
ncbi:MAG: hypothetical protein ACRDU0_18860 [Mycobacterium sp.]